MKERKREDDFKQAHVNYVCSQPNGTKLLSQDTFIAGCECGFQYCKDKSKDVIEKILATLNGGNGVEQVIRDYWINYYLKAIEE